MSAGGSVGAVFYQQGRWRCLIRRGGGRDRGSGSAVTSSAGADSLVSGIFSFCRSRDRQNRKYTSSYGVPASTALARAPQKAAEQAAADGIQSKAEHMTK